MSEPWSSQQSVSFEEPWQAELFAVTVELSKGGMFTLATWTEYFGNEIRRSPQDATETVNAAYYRQWLAALERLLADLGSSSGAEIDDNQEHWRRSYAVTEHGKPVVFSRKHPPIDDHADHHHDHHHEHHHDAGGALNPRPVTVSPAISRQ